MVGTVRSDLQLWQSNFHSLIFSSFISSVFCLLQTLHWTYSPIYFLKRFYTLVVVRIVFITKPLLPMDPSILPKSLEKKFFTWSGCLSSCLHRDTKLMIAVFLVPIFSTFGGFKIIFVSSARSGLFFVRVSTIFCKSYLYLFSFVFAISATFFYYSWACIFELSILGGFLVGFLKSIVSIA